jgi:acetolactate synthase-1/3 small subunit
MGLESLTIELTGDPSKVNAFIEFLSQYEILELCHTGVTAINRGTTTIKAE